MALTLVTLKATYVDASGNGIPGAQFAIAPPAVILGNDPEETITISDQYVLGTTDANGSLIALDGTPLQVYLSDNPGLNPSGFTYHAGVRFPKNEGFDADYALTQSVCDRDPWDGSLSVDLTKLTPVSSSLGTPIIRGAAGPPNSLVIGSVTIGVAAASITGIAPNQTLNLVYPGGGAGAASFMYTQSGAATVWPVQHDLGYYPNVSTFSTDLSIQWTDFVVQHVDSTKLILTFDDPIDGIAVCT